MVTFSPTFLSRKLSHVQYRDFSYFKMDKINNVRYVGGFARAGGVSGEEYLNAAPDPIAPFASKISSHMNEDHADSIVSMVKHYIGVPVSDARIVSLDRLGMTIQANLLVANTGVAKLRLPFIREAPDRKSVKDVLV